MLLNIKTCENGWYNFSENLRIVALKLLVNSIPLTKSINLPFFILILFGVRVRGDRRRFSVLSQFKAFFSSRPGCRPSGVRLIHFFSSLILIFLKYSASKIHFYHTILQEWWSCRSGLGSVHLY